MNEKELFVLTKCPTCGEEMRVKVNVVNVYCLKCNKWSKVVPLNNKETDIEKNGLN